MKSKRKGNSDIVNFQKCKNVCLHFTLPGYPDIVLTSGSDHSMVNMRNLDDYVSLFIDATAGSGISRQIKAFESGFNQIDHIRILNEKEVERLFLFDSWTFVTGAPLLPPRELASLNPMLTTVKKQSSNEADTHLPSVMTCVNYLKLPFYSSKGTH